MSALLRAHDLLVAYATRRVLDGVSFDADSGEFLAILGNNGAGKSTLLDVLSGSRIPDSGHVVLAGRHLQGWSAPERARRLSHLPQALPVDVPFTAGQLVAMGRYPHTDRWFESEDDHRAVAEAMRRTGSSAWQQRPVATLSGGERQRVYLAAALAQQAGVLLLDEPSTFLDISQQLACFELLRKEAGAGRLCLAVTHDLNLALRFSTRLLVLESGRIAYDLPVHEAARDPAWLAALSPRLLLHPSEPDGVPWVGFR